MFSLFAATWVIAAVITLKKGSMREEIRQAYRVGESAKCVLLSALWLEENPDDIRVFHDYATTLYEMYRYDDAVMAYHNALERFPDEEWAIFNQLGHLYCRRGNLAQAEISYRKAIESDPTEAASYAFLGELQLKSGDLDAAEETFRNAIRILNGASCDLYFGLGIVFRSQGKYFEAKECFHKTLEIFDGHKNAAISLRDVDYALQRDA